MALFNKKKKQEEASAAVNEKEFDYKEAVLKALDEKLNGSTLYDGCIIMPRGFTIDVKIGRRDEKDGIKRTAWSVRVDELEFIGGKKDDAQQGQQPAPQQESQEGAEPAPTPEPEAQQQEGGNKDDLPF